MERQTQLTTVTPEPQGLTERENYAFQQFLKARNVGKNPSDFPIAPATAAKLFELYLIGKTTEEIRQLNPQFTLGQIVHSRIENEWDTKYVEYKKNLHLRIREKLENTVLETTSAIAELLSAKNKMYRERVLRYIQTGDETHIADIGLGGVDGYRKLVEILQKLTGTESTTKNVQGTIVHKVEPATSQQSTLTAQKAEDVIEAILLKNGTSE